MRAIFDDMRRLVRRNSWKKVLQYMFFSLCIFQFFKVMKPTKNKTEEPYIDEFVDQAEEIQKILDEIESHGHTNALEINKARHNYVILIDPSEKFCRKSCDSLDMIFIVKSFVGNFDQRIAIRKTWGDVKNIKMKTLFILGYVKPMQFLVKIESSIYQDILQYDTQDNYENLVHKTIFSVSWLASLGIDTKFVHLIDDDRFVNTIQIYEFGLENLSPTESKMIGYRLSFTKPIRDPSSRHFLSFKQYPYRFYPPYLIGGTILTNMHVIKTMAMVFPYIKLFPVEDTYIGVVARLLNLEVVHNSGFLAEHVSGSELVGNLSSPYFISYDETLHAWSELNGEQ